MKEQFTDHRFHAKTLATIDQANVIIDEYLAAGLKLTLRQLYYQFVARGFIPNSIREYKKLGTAINDGRLAGLIDWEAIEDRTRGLETQAHFESPRDAIERVRKAYGIDMWANQPDRVEVWVEKEALVGVIERVCRSWDVPYFACRGYVSQSEQWRAYHRLLDAARGGRSDNEGDEQRTVILHLGDHDPSGIDMTRDNNSRLEMFLSSWGREHEFEVRRLALNRDQIDRYKPPPNPAKQTDARFKEYAKLHGKLSWELDALEPKVLSKLIEKHIKDVMDHDLWNVKVAQLQAEEAKLDKIIAGL